MDHHSTIHITYWPYNTIPIVNKSWYGDFFFLCGDVHLGFSVCIWTKFCTIALKESICKRLTSFSPLCVCMHLLMWVCVLALNLFVRNNRGPPTCPPRCLACLCHFSTPIHSRCSVNEVTPQHLCCCLVYLPTIVCADHYLHMTPPTNTHWLFPR